MKQFAAAALAALALVGLASRRLPAAAETATHPPGELTELASHDGILDVTLRAQPGKVRIGDIEVEGMSYNGLYAGPVLRVRPGDMLRVRLVNQLSQPTNLHFHGIRTSPLGNSDNVHISVPAGSTFVYEVRIPPSQPPGLYWYHSHIHGASEAQVMGGLSGALVVDPPDGSAAAAPTPADSPARLSGKAEKIFVLKDIVFDDDTGNDRIDDQLHGVVQSVNGMLDIKTAARPGEVQFWRFGNQSADRAFHIALQGHRFRIVEEDGEAIAGERWTDVLDIMPSSRVEVLLEAGAAGSYALLSKGMMTGTGAARVPDRVLGQLIVAGVPETRAAASVASMPDDTPDLRAAHIDTTRSVVLSQTKTLNADAQLFFVDGRVFDATRVDVSIPLGSIQEWTIRNDSDDLHVFHIHQLGFQVVRINDAPVALNNRVDTIRVPERGTVTIRMAFTDPVIIGRFMFHCHVLKHEDKGMMAQIEVYDPRPSTLEMRMRRLYLQVWWWLHGVPWTMCGLSHA